MPRGLGGDVDRVADSVWRKGPCKNRYSGRIALPGTGYNDARRALRAIGIASEVATRRRGAGPDGVGQGVAEVA